VVGFSVPPRRGVCRNSHQFLTLLVGVLLGYPGQLESQECATGLGRPQRSHGLSVEFISKEHSRGLGASVWVKRPAGQFLRAGGTILRPRRTSLTEVNLDFQLGTVTHPSRSWDLSVCPTAGVGVELLDGGSGWSATTGLLAAWPLSHPSPTRALGILAGGGVEYTRTSLDFREPVITKDLFGSFELGGFYRLSDCVAAAALGQVHFWRIQNDPSVRVVFSFCL